MLYILFLFIQSVFSLTCPTSVEETLEHIYLDMGGPKWAANNWLAADTPYCSWTGVECNQNKDVIFLNLSSMGLSGNISEYVGCLTYLKSIYLNDNNGLTGSFPASMCGLVNLSYLQISNNNITGSLPDCICDMRSLMHFYMNNNNLTGAIPTCVGSLVYLKEMHLECNSISGTVPSGFNSIANLSELWLQCNGSLTCPSESPIRLFYCGNSNCADCALSTGECPNTLQVEGCGSYAPLGVILASRPNQTIPLCTNTK